MLISRSVEQVKRDLRLLVLTAKCCYEDHSTLLSSSTAFIPSNNLFPSYKSTVCVTHTVNLIAEVLK